jgi:hypothetical protein
LLADQLLQHYTEAPTSASETNQVNAACFLTNM